MSELKPFLGLLRRHQGWVLLGSFLGLLTLFSSIGLLTLSGWFISATALAGVTLASAQAFNYLTPGGGVRGFAIARTAGRYFERVTTHEATFRVLAELRSWFYAHLEPLNPARLRHYRSADLLSRITSDINALDNLYLRVLSPSAIALITSLLVAGFMAWIHASLGFLLLGALLLAGFGVPWLGYLWAGQRGAEQVQLSARLRARTLSYVQGMTELHVYAALEKEQQALAQTQNDWLRLQQQMSLISGVTSALMTLAAGLTTFAALAIAIELVSSESLAPAWLALVVFCVLASFEAIAPLPLAYQYLGKTRAAARNLLEITQQRSDISFPDTRVNPPHPGQIEWSAVNFAYEGREVLQDFTLQIAAGEKLAITGHTGSGKSTLINLLTRFWEAQSGEIRLGGAPLNHYPEEQLREQMAILSQPVQLFAGSVRDNLRLAGDDISDAEMLQLLQRLGLDTMLGNEGLDREVGEGGNRLSGGQRKRLGVARALLKKAPILILDEPAEGLDAQSEAQMLEVVLSYRPEQTLLLITHHTQHLQAFDRVIRLDRGRLVGV